MAHTCHRSTQEVDRRIGIQGQLGLHEALPKNTPSKPKPNPKETPVERSFCGGWKGLLRAKGRQNLTCTTADWQFCKRAAILFQKIFHPHPDCNPNLTLGHFQIFVTLWSQSRDSDGVPEAADQLPSTWKPPLWLPSLQGVWGR